jgi:ankyrin repeat protein
MRALALRLTPFLAVCALAACLTPLHEAADRNDVPAIKQLIASGADPNVINEGADRWTPMNSAIYRGHFDAAKALLELGADPEFHTAMGTPLQFALAQHQTAIAELIRQAIDRKYGRGAPPAPAPEPEAASETAPAPAADKPAAPAAKPWWQ